MIAIAVAVILALLAFALPSLIVAWVIGQIVHYLTGRP